MVCFRESSRVRESKPPQEKQAREKQMQNQCVEVSCELRGATPWELDGPTPPEPRAGRAGEGHDQ